MIKYCYFTHAEMDALYSELARQISNKRFHPQVVVGLSRGGLDAGIKLSHYFDVPMVPLVWQTRDGQDKEIAVLQDVMSKYENILIVDDICDSGLTFESIQSQVEIHNTDCNIKYAAAIENIDNDVIIDFTAMSISRAIDERWFVFPWENWWWTANTGKPQ